MRFKHFAQFGGKSHLPRPLESEKTTTTTKRVFNSTKFTFTWITGKELGGEINNNGEKFRWKKNMKII